MRKWRDSIETIMRGRQLETGSGWSKEAREGKSHIANRKGKSWATYTRRELARHAAVDVITENFCYSLTHCRAGISTWFVGHRNSQSHQGWHERISEDADSVPSSSFERRTWPLESPNGQRQVSDQMISIPLMVMFPRCGREDLDQREDGVPWSRVLRSRRCSITVNIGVSA